MILLYLVFITLAFVMGHRRGRADGLEDGYKRGLTAVINKKCFKCLEDATCIAYTGFDVRSFCPKHCPTCPKS